MQQALVAAATLLTAPPQGGGQGPGLAQFMVPIALIFMIFYFLLLRPQKRREQERQAMLGALKKGDTVFTNAGIIGKIKQIDEREVSIEIDKKGASIRVLRQTVAGRYDKKGTTEPKLESQPGQAEAVAEAAKA